MAVASAATLVAAQYAEAIKAMGAAHEHFRVNYAMNMHFVSNIMTLIVVEATSVFHSFNIN